MSTDAESLELELYKALAIRSAYAKKLNEALGGNLATANYNILSSTAWLHRAVHSHTEDCLEALARYEATLAGWIK